jgi:hypothetical protein
VFFFRFFSEKERCWQDPDADSDGKKERISGGERPLYVLYSDIFLKNIFFVW